MILFSIILKNLKVLELISLSFQDFEIEFYHSGEIESSETDADCRTGTEDDEALLERIMVAETDGLALLTVRLGLRLGLNIMKH